MDKCPVSLIFYFNMRLWQCWGGRSTTSHLIWFTIMTVAIMFNDLKSVLHNSYGFLPFLLCFSPTLSRTFLPAFHLYLIFSGMYLFP